MGIASQNIFFLLCAGRVETNNYAPKLQRSGDVIKQKANMESYDQGQKKRRQETKGGSSEHLQARPY